MSEASLSEASLSEASLSEAFQKIINDFNNCFVNGNAKSMSITYVKPNARLKAVKDLLASLRSFSKKPQPPAEEMQNLDTALFLSSINRPTKVLYFIIREPATSQETIILSSLALALLTYNAYQHCRMQGIYAIESYLRFFSDDDSRFAFICDCEDTIQPKSIKKLLQCKVKNTKPSFVDIACLHGLFNCAHMMQIFVSQLSDQFSILHEWILVLLKSPLGEEYHLYQVFRDFSLNLFESYILMSYDKEYNSYIEFIDCSIFSVIRKSIDVMDHRWESPAANVGKLLKETYSYLIKTAANVAIENHNHIFFLSREFSAVMNIPYTSKAKYNKLSILLQNLTTKINLSLPSGNKPDTPPYLLPFYHDHEFAKKTLQNLSINTLTHSIVEFYKKSIEAIVRSHSDDLQAKAMWANFWLDALKNVFIENVLESAIVNNSMVSHILPFTMKSIPDSYEDLWDALEQYPYGQISIVKVRLRKNASNEKVKVPGQDWLEEMLQLGDDMSRLEALSLLVEENLISNNRPLVCELLFKFLRRNLNIDNAHVRQKIVSIVESFYRKLIASLSSRYPEGHPINNLPKIDKQILKFLKDLLDFLFVSLTPGASFQRKFTALSMLASLFKVFEKEDSNRVFLKFFEQYPRGNNWHHMLIYGLVDKDDRIRKMVTDALINLSFHFLGKLCFYEKNFFHDTHFVAMKLLKSPRHQETHVGGLMLKYLFYSLHIENGNGKISNPGFQLLTSLTNRSIHVFNSDMFRKSTLIAARKDPLHGYLLALNQLMNSAIFMKGIARQNIIESDVLTSLLKKLPFRNDLFNPLIQVSIEIIEYFLKMLAPKNFNDSILSVNDDETIEDDEGNFSSPSFFEMGQSIVQVILDSDESISEERRDHIFQSNDFQLILSMAWLNIKEACFLLVSLTSCFASMLELFVKNRDISNYSSAIKCVLTWIQPEELSMIGSKITSIMLRCRHKGVIEAAGKSLSIFTKRMIEIQRHLRILIGYGKMFFYDQAMNTFIKGIVEIVDLKNTSASVTRRAAGLAFITQAVLCGEVMAREDVNSGEMTTYNEIVKLLIQNSKMPISNEASTKIFSDLPQANALHILQSIVTTSELSQFTMKTVVDLFPLCVDGFKSKFYTIRNASLQLFGACVQRMLGQKKRTKTADSELANELGTTITFDEFASRYPQLIPAIIEHFNGNCFPSVDRGYLVPILSLLSEFTPCAEDHDSVASEFYEAKIILINILKSLLPSPIWKVRELAARALCNFLKWNDFETFIFSLQKKDNCSSNYYHGLTMLGDNMCKKYSLTGNNLVIETIDSLHEGFPNTSKYFKFESIRNESISTGMEVEVVDVGNIIENIPENPGALPFTHFGSIFHSTIDSSSSGFHEISLNNEFIDYLDSSISFRNSDIVRKEGSERLYQLILNGAFCDNPKVMTLFYDILLRILEDEEREVRYVGQKIVAALEERKKFSDQTSSIEAVIEMLLERPLNRVICKDQTLNREFSITLIEHFLDRMFDIASMKPVRELFRQNEIYNEEYEFVLFEKEQKNVFSEPYLMSTRIGSFLMMLMRQVPDYFDEYFDSALRDKMLETAADDVEIILDHICLNHIEKLVLLSIWRLPDFINRLSNLLYLLKLSVAKRLNLKYCRIIQRIEVDFPLLVKNASLVVGERGYNEIPFRACTRSTQIE